MMVPTRCWKPPEIVKIELTVVILCFLPSSLAANATLNHTPSAYPQLNQPRLLQKARRFRIASALARFSSNAPNGAAGLPPTYPY